MAKEKSLLTSLTLATILQASILAATAAGGASVNPIDDYAAARAKTTKTGQPIVILVGAEWCPACVEMKQNVMPKIRKQGILRRVVFANVNLDRQGKLAKQLTGGGPIPQMIMYRKTRKGWLRRALIGGQSPKTIENFIQQGVDLDAATKKTESARKPAAEGKQVRNNKPASGDRA